MSQFGLIPEAEQHAEQPEPDDGRHRRARRRRVGGLLAVGVSVAIVAGLAAVAYLAVSAGSQWLGGIDLGGPEDYTGNGGALVRVTIEDGETLAEVGDTLLEADVVASSAAFVEAADANPDATSIQPGVYALPQQIPAEQAVVLLVEGTTKVVKSVTLVEGLRVEQSLSVLSDAAGIGQKQLDTAARTKDIGLPPYANGDPEGYLFPATYELEPQMRAVPLLRATTDRYARAAERLRLERRAREAGLSPAEVVTVASLVQAEARLDEDFGKVARVIYNRLEDGQALQLDSTVLFANDDVGVYTSDRQRALDDPYNTYVYPGLPPGPINSPGEQALEAALDPTPGEWRYFATVNLDTGETKYAETLDEHNKHVAELRRWEANN